MDTDKIDPKDQKQSKASRSSTLLYEDLTYGVIGALYKVFNELGFGYREKHYQKALAKEFSRMGVKFKMEKPSRIIYSGAKVGAYFYDFLIEDKLILELKVGEGIYIDNIKQLLSYLKDSRKRLGILAVFTSHGVRYKRIIN